MTIPQNIEAERAVLGAMLTGPHVIDDIAELVAAADFYQPTHEAIFAAALRVHRDGSRPDPVLVERALGAEAKKCGGAPYLFGLTTIETIPTPAQGPQYAAMVRESAIARRILEATTRIRQRVEDGGDIEVVAQDARHEIDAATSEVAGSTVGVGASELMSATLDALETGHNPGISTGWSDLDHYVNGLRPGQFVVIGARPSVGKSVVAANIAAAACRDGHGVHFASLEMSRDETMKRLIASHATVNLSRLMDHKLEETDWQRIARRMDINEWPLWIDDTQGQTLQQIRSRARNTARRMKLGLIVIDYLQLMKPRTRDVPREQQVGEMSEGIKSLAKELAVPIIALAQVNRGPADRTDQRPRMSDLRESGRIEADADHVWLLHREDLVKGTATGELEILVAKNRNGASGAVVTMHFQGHYSRAVQRTWVDKVTA